MAHDKIGKAGSLAKFYDVTIWSLVSFRKEFQICSLSLKGRFRKECEKTCKKPGCLTGCLPVSWRKIWKKIPKKKPSRNLGVLLVLSLDYTIGVLCARCFDLARLAVPLVQRKASQIKLRLMPSLPTNKKIRIRMRITVRMRTGRRIETRIKMTGNDVANSNVGSCERRWNLWLRTIMQCYPEDRKETGTVSFGSSLGGYDCKSHIISGATNRSMGISYSSAIALLLTYTMVLHLE